VDGVKADLPSPGRRRRPRDARRLRPVASIAAGAGQFFWGQFFWGQEPAEEQCGARLAMEAAGEIFAPHIGLNLEPEAATYIREAV
jgi:hypothetical protein